MALKGERFYEEAEEDLIHFDTEMLKLGNNYGFCMNNIPLHHIIF